jgi:(S)-2-hydroxyglutarate dehydrogenase
VDVVIVGAGIVGLACARELVRRHPRLSVVVVDKESSVGAHQTSHNSGVIHAGVYYAPGSLKARLCVEGARLMWEFCEEHGVRAERTGKLIVATRPVELPRLNELARRAAANGVAGVRQLSADEITAIEPQAAGLAALHSPNTGVVDYGEVARAMARDLTVRGAVLRLNTEVRVLTPDAHGVRVQLRDGLLRSRRALVCAGAWSDRLATGSGAPAHPRIVPFRGAYLRIRSDRSDLVRGLVYPVPDPALPFLGVHVTRHVDHSITLGPTALPVGARDAYRLTRVRARDVADTLLWPGTARMAWRFRHAVRPELWRAASRRHVVHEAAKLVPALRLEDVAGHAEPGIRAQALDRSGRLVDDFEFSTTTGILHVRNAPSPAATSSLAIGREIVTRLERELGLPRTRPAAV